MGDLTRLNAAQTAALRALVSPFIESEDEAHVMGKEECTDILIALEGVVVGTFLMVVLTGGDAPVMEKFMEGCMERLKEARRERRG